jgi:hypothetical protein
MRLRSIAWVVLAAALVAGGCLPESTPGADAGATPYLFPDIIHSGYDGEHVFRVPVGTNLEGDVTWEVVDAPLATVEPTTAPDNLQSAATTWVMVTTSGAGTTRIIARKGDASAEAMLIIASYAAADVSLGDMRYNAPANPGPGREACASCHVLPGGSATDVDHSPVSMTLYTDDEILSAVTTSAFPDGLVIDGGNHVQDLTIDERRGVVPFMRSLPPRGFP